MQHPSVGQRLPFDPITEENLVPIIDVHTHMLSAAYLETMQGTADCPYTVRENSSGARAIFRGDTAFVVELPAGRLSAASVFRHRRAVAGGT